MCNYLLVHAHDEQVLFLDGLQIFHGRLSLPTLLLSLPPLLLSLLFKVPVPLLQFSDAPVLCFLLGTVSCAGLLATSPDLWLVPVGRHDGVETAVPAVSPPTKVVVHEDRVNRHHVGVSLFPVLLPQGLSVLILPQSRCLMLVREWRLSKELK